MDIIYRTNIVQSRYENLPLSLQLLGSLGWEATAKIIIQCKHQVRHYNEGLTLCAFSINYLNGNKGNMLLYTILENGMDCIKSLNENLLDGNIDLDPNSRELIKRLINAGLDVCKENIKESLREEELLFVP